MTATVPEKGPRSAWTYIQPGEGASCDVLVRRVAYGGRKGLSALHRLNRHCKILNPATHGTPAVVPLFPVTCDCGVELADFDEAAALELAIGYQATTLVVAST